jgi:hypothetical protein
VPDHLLIGSGIFSLSEAGELKRRHFAGHSEASGNVYVQVVEENVMRAVNSHASTVLEGWTPAVESMGLTGRNLKRLAEPFSGSESNLVKFGEV